MILILTQCYPSRIGGIESLVSNLSLELAKTEKIIVFADRHNYFYDSVFDSQHKNLSEKIDINLFDEAGTQSVLNTPIDLNKNNVIIKSFEGK